MESIQQRERKMKLKTGMPTLAERSPNTSSERINSVFGSLMK
jgi:hypothetical protein